jgi:hypothetical protein
MQLKKRPANRGDHLVDADKMVVLTIGITGPREWSHHCGNTRYAASIDAPPLLGVHLFVIGLPNGRQDQDYS